MIMQEWIVAVIVACAVWAVAKRYLPKAARQAVRRWSARAASRLGWSWMASRLEATAEAGSSCADGCGTCGSCGSSGAPPTDAQFAITPEALKRTARR
jgi:hypothetical protein